MTTYLVTGANGFIGRTLCEYLMAQGITVHGTVRRPWSNAVPGVKVKVTGDINGDTDWSDALVDVDVVLHLAGTVHQPQLVDPAIYLSSIADATFALAKQAAAAGVQRFVYVSTAHVYGISGHKGVLESHPKIPLTPYGVAKSLAEDRLQQLAQSMGLPIVIVRPPLVYGAGVGGNFMLLTKLIERLPIVPLGRATSPRSFVGRGNLVNFLYHCTHHPNAVNSVFNISDDHDVSTQQLCALIAKIRRRKTILLPVPARLMQFFLSIIGKGKLYNKLFDPMCLDVHAAKTVLDWKPIFDMEQELRG